MDHIPFTQYLLPHGRKAAVSIERPDDICKKAKQIREAGFEFEVEALRTGQISLTIADPQLGVDVAVRVCHNNEEVPENVDSMVTGFNIQKALAFRNREQ